MSLEGADDMQRALARLMAGAVSGAASGLYLGASVIMTDAKKRAPLEYGDLRGSGYVTVPEAGTGERQRDSRGRFISGAPAAGEVAVEMGFGGPAADYAVPQHERTDYAHTDGEAKYLEKALDAKSGEAAAIIGERIDAGMRGQPTPIAKLGPESPWEEGGA